MIPPQTTVSHPMRHCRCGGHAWECLAPTNFEYTCLNNGAAEVSEQTPQQLLDLGAP